MNRKSPFVVALALAAGPFLVFACGEENPQPTAPTASVSAMPTPTPTSTETAMPTASETASEAPVAPKPPPPTVEDMTPSPDPKPMPAAHIMAPANDSSVGDAAKAKDYVIKFDVKNWKLGENGQHLHLILDNGPYKKITDAKAPVKLGELVGEGKDIAEGQHFLILFPSRGTHETVKGKGAASFVTFWVGKKDKTKMVYDGKKPLLIYSRPKGDNWGEMGKNVMIDFYLHDTTLSDGSKVHYSISGGALDQPVVGDFTQWAPKIVHGLQKGEYDVTIQLVDKDGKPSDLAWNTTTRHINVDPDHADDPKMGMPPMTMGSSAAPATSASGK